MPTDPTPAHDNEIDQRTLDEVALSRAEYQQIVELLGREPNDVELGMFGAMWSEHCGYKNSRPLLQRFPTTGAARARQGRRGERRRGRHRRRAGASSSRSSRHNHPSAIEPYQGAATGVGGIVRDIFTMGARPIALLDSLRFGPLERAAQPLPLRRRRRRHRRLRQLPRHPDRRRRDLLRRQPTAAIRWSTRCASG